MIVRILEMRAKEKARALGLRIEKSTRSGKKWDAYDTKTGEYQASFGATGYDDYASFLAKERRGEVPQGTAAKRRAAYKARHAKDRAVQKRDGRYTPGYLADQILW